MNADERRGGTEGASGSDADRAQRERDTAARKPGAEQENESQRGRAAGDATNRGPGGTPAPGARPAVAREAGAGRVGSEKDAGGANDTGDANERRDRSANR